MIAYDRTTRSVVAICTACGARDVFNDQREADAWAVRHVDRAHPAPTRQHVNALSAAATRARRR